MEIRLDVDRTGAQIRCSAKSSGPMAVEGGKRWDSVKTEGAIKEGELNWGCSSWFIQGEREESKMILKVVPGKPDGGKVHFLGWRTEAEAGGLCP